MAGYSDLSFRQICCEEGAFLAYTEMVSANAMVHHSEKTMGLMKTFPGETLAVQLFASDPEVAAKAAGIISKRVNPAIIDLNCGCSIPKILKAGCGAELLRHPKRIGEIIKAIKSETSSIVTLKFRSGWDFESINYLETAEEAQKNGAEMLTLHPRTRSQLFKGIAKLEHLADLKKHASVHVIGSGDLFSPEDVLNMMLKTAVDGVMIARGAIGNPFIFNQTIKLLTNKEASPPPSAEWRIKTAMGQLELTIADRGEERACKEMRKHFSAYTKGIEGSSILRRDIIRAKTLDEYKSITQAFLKKQ